MTHVRTRSRQVFIILLMLIGLSDFALGAQQIVAAEATKINPELLTKLWSARWISVPNTSPFDYGVYHFRRTFDLQAKPSSFIVHVTGDNRYQLFVNGERIVCGPARGDLNHWRFETVDIASHLKAGKNLLAAVLWNFGQYSPEAQVTDRTAFLLQGDTTPERLVDTNNQWKCMRNPAYQPLHYTHAQMRGYFVMGPADKVDGASYPWGWEQLDFDDSAWAQAHTDSRWSGSPRGARDGPNRWQLVPRNIPPMEERPERLAVVRQSSGANVPANFPQLATPFTISANTKARLLLDQAHLTTAYPELIVSGGKGALVKIGYAESLFVNGTNGNEKGNRNDVEGKTFVGYYDIFTSDGGSKRMYRPLWWRTYRYVELNIETKDQPLIVEDLRGV
jgi:alpha-L-rhamnosidase